jgi:hypothetical protein
MFRGILSFVRKTCGSENVLCFSFFSIKNNHFRKLIPGGLRSFYGNGVSGSWSKLGLSPRLLGPDLGRNSHQRLAMSVMIGEVWEHPGGQK